MERINDRIAYLMKVRGLNQKGLAALVNVTEGAVSRYINGDREPKVATIAKIADALHTTTDYLICGRETVPEYDDVFSAVVQGVGSMSDGEKLALIKVLVSGANRGKEV